MSCLSSRILYASAGLRFHKHPDMSPCESACVDCHCSHERCSLLGCFRMSWVKTTMEICQWLPPGSVLAFDLWWLNNRNLWDCLYQATSAGTNCLESRRFRNASELLSHKHSVLLGQSVWRPCLFYLWSDSRRGCFPPLRRRQTAQGVELSKWKQQTELQSICI